MNDFITPSNDEGNITEVNRRFISQNDKTTKRQEVEVEVKVNSIELFNELPPLLQNICNTFEERHKLMILLGSITMISSILPNVFGEYGERKVYPNLYMYVIGKAGSGKGNLMWVRNLINAIEKGRTLQSTTNIVNSSLLEELCGQDPKMSKVTPQNKLVIPANSSAAGFTQLLSELTGAGLMFETEGDTLANILKKDFGGYDDILRKAFHHEPITQYRKTENIRVDLDEPKLSVLISSTPRQLTRIISSAENGLFSRFMFLHTSPVEEFENVFKKGSVNKTDVFETSSNDLANLYVELSSLDQLEFTLTEEQSLMFVQHFNQCKSQMMNLFHEDLDATVNRMGLITFRIAMILTVLRQSKEIQEGEIVCADIDFQKAIQLSEILLKNANEAMVNLPLQTKDANSTAKMALFIALPEEFTTGQAKAQAKNLGISDRTVDRFLTTSCFEKLRHSYFRKAS